MEQQTLPNSQAILILGILSIPLCCCYGIPALVLGIIAIVLAKKATDLHNENPEMYKGFQNVKTGKILAIIGISLGVIYIIINIAMIAIYGFDGLQEMQQEMLQQYNLEG
ncbi:hypothetical protein ULMS_20700 [Patiriisocius marinistellae]|uniref:DUF4190 domain-containing protein n=1 Tax=Patiriisocius marinistellae TaxID=2494560 RepID=A0A5J4FZ90_9FLAO|nr:CCC motif membrane protein [Patiriisocius marinistellae]GEQ86562.1 hypothetical protein ULMS_20700 [Patiriisocius marinistellae]